MEKLDRRPLEWEICFIGENTSTFGGSFILMVDPKNNVNHGGSSPEDVCLTFKSQMVRNAIDVGHWQQFFRFDLPHLEGFSGYLTNKDWTFNQLYTEAFFYLP